MIKKRFDAEDKGPIVALYWPQDDAVAKRMGDGKYDAKRIDVVYVSGDGGYATWFEVEQNDGNVTQHNAAFVESVERGPLPKP